MKRYKYKNKPIAHCAYSWVGIYEEIVEWILRSDEFNIMVSDMDDQGWEFISLSQCGLTWQAVFRSPYIPETDTNLERELKQSIEDEEQ